MKTLSTPFHVLLGGLAALVFAFPALAQDAPPPPAPIQEADYDDDAPDEDWVWVDGHQFADGTVEEGFYRVRTRPDHVWTPATVVDGTWVGPRWRWSGPARVGQIYVPGHRGPDGYWVRGYWRKELRAGHRWVVSTTLEGRRIHAHWSPVEARADHIWVPGHWSRRGHWVPGHWRLVNRDGYVWVRGHWRYGHWMPGHWRPVKASSENVWIGGYHHNGIWVTGMWRPRSKVGFHWRRGRWGPKGWVVGSWVGGKRPILKRRHRVIRYDRMSKRRVQKRRTWRRGEAQRRTGKGQQRRGKAMTRTGKATGNKRLERKGKKTTRRGKKNVRKGKSKKRRSRR